MAEQVPDPDDIFRPINEDEENERGSEITRLIPKLRALKSHFTAAYNVLNNILRATRGQDDNFDRSAGTRSALERAREKLELRFHKTERCFNRLLALSHDDESANKLETDFHTVQERYANQLHSFGQLMIDMLPRQAPQPQGGGAF